MKYESIVWKVEIMLIIYIYWFKLRFVHSIIKWMRGASKNEKIQISNFKFSTIVQRWTFFVNKKLWSPESLLAITSYYMHTDLTAVLQ